MPEKTLSTIKPRKYQQEIYKTCKNKNCLVVLPTGIGKTLIALMLSINRQKAVPGSKILFLAPTRPLADQHFAYFKKHLPELFAELTLFTGKIDAEKRKQLWQNSDIIFSTPQCIGNDIKNNLYELSEVSLLIEDECHRCLKNYSYTYVAKKYLEQSKNPRILGLTASPGTERKTIEQIALNLGIEAIELRTRESEDVKEYLQELKFYPIKLELPEEFKAISGIIRKMYEKKVEELKNRKLIHKPANKITLLEVQGNIMRAINSGHKNFNYFAGVSACAQAIKLSHLMELLETQTLHASYEYMKSLFEQSTTGKSKAAKQLAKTSEFNKAYISLTELISRKIEHPKLLELKSLVEEAIKENPKSKSIVFSQYRDTASVISKELNQIPGISAKVFVGQTKKGDTGLSQKEQQQIITEFSEGKINILCATSIAEEGLDIPEVSSVIFYEPIPSAIRHIQRRGRTARLMPGRLIILLTLGTLDEIFYYASRAKEKRMYNAIENLKQDLDAGKPIRPGSAPTIPKKPETVQIRETPEKPKPEQKKPYPIFQDKAQKKLF
jgi:ERCC4-related helicase